MYQRVTAAGGAGVAAGGLAGWAWLVIAGSTLLAGGAAAWRIVPLVRRRHDDEDDS